MSASFHSRWHPWLSVSPQFWTVTLRDRYWIPSPSGSWSEPSMKFTSLTALSCASTCIRVRARVEVTRPSPGSALNRCGVAPALELNPVYMVRGSLERSRCQRSMPARQRLFTASGSSAAGLGVALSGNPSPLASAYTSTLVCPATGSKLNCTILSFCRFSWKLCRVSSRREVAESMGSMKSQRFCISPI